MHLLLPLMKPDANCIRWHMSPLKTRCVVRFVLVVFILNLATSLPIPFDHYNFTACPASPQNTTRNSTTTQVIPTSHPQSRSLTGTLAARSESHFQCQPTKGFYSLSTLSQEKDCLESGAPLQLFQEHFRTQNHAGRGFSIALWFQPNNVNQPGPRAILTMGITNSTDAPLLPCGDPYHLRIAQVGQHLVVSFTDSNQICSTLPVKVYELISDLLTHLVIAFNERSMQVYINGKPMYRHGALRETIHIPNWTDMNRTTLQLFSNYVADDQVFYGRIHQLDLYDTALTEYQVATLDSGGVGFWSSPIFNTNEEDDDELFQLVPNYDPRPLVASPQLPTILIDQNETLSYIPIPFRSCNQSNPARQYAIQITSTPQYGSIFLSVDGTPSNVSSLYPLPPSYLLLQVNDLLPLYGNDTEVIVYYRLASTDYFNIPTHNGYGSDLRMKPEGLQYRVVELDLTTSWEPDTESPTYVKSFAGELVKESKIVTIPIYVVHVNADPLKLVVSPDSVARLNENTVVIRGLDILGANLNIDFVRVDVSLPSSSAGTISFNPTYWSLLSRGRAMQQCSTRWYSDWQCSTDEINSTATSSSTTFIALPSDISWILNEMKATSYTSEKSSLTIRIHDGIGGDCLYAEEHWTLNNATNDDLNQWGWAAMMLPLSNATMRSILNHMYYRNNSCATWETSIMIPGSDVAYSTNQATDVRQKRSLKILGFEWKEFLFGALVLLVLVGCLFGCCK